MRTAGHCSTCVCSVERLDPGSVRYDQLRPGDRIRFSRSAYANHVWTVLESNPVGPSGWTLLVECLTDPIRGPRMRGLDLTPSGEVELVEAA